MESPKSITAIAKNIQHWVGDCLRKLIPKEASLDSSELHSMGQSRRSTALCLTPMPVVVLKMVKSNTFYFSE